MTDNKVIPLWGRVSPGEAEESARQAYRRRMYQDRLEQYDQEDFDFEQGIHDQIARLRDICDGDSLPFRHGDQVLPVPFHLFVDALDKKLRSGMAALRIDEDPEGGKVAQIIPLRRSIKPKKPKSPYEVTPAMPVRKTLSPEELEERRIKLEAMKAERLHVREERLDFMRSRYGEEPARAYATLMGWR
ncbi:hypothetical protein HF290_03115 [Acidithiobacillus ferrooxidans]|uniref:hypothetical protein n=1 Tax=Acidithiobacillus ferrooxidans TaxID=920 RepID=UPI001C07CF0E|nr:hypothetical protein [Acidithiobacillus ferrooxidans]MBU2859438.1 hypothetical protein [Acidithiobacillus ferrooxidans]